ncbi:MAG: DUF885 family protein, partial [Elusimicrobiaceae bacterium]|nr:DUF885 family protein [Elusimicrobiaceae bacterium]
MSQPKLSVFLAVCAGMCFTPVVHAQANFDFENIETILEDNTLDEAANRYSSVILSSLPEQGTRLGFSSSNDKLDSRTPQQNAQLLLALEALRSSVNEINEKKLSQAKQADRALLISALESSMLQANQERAAHDPLYYTQALDSIYDLLTKQVASPIRQRMDLLARLTALSKVADQAEQNLTSADPYAIELAMEKAYHAFLSTDEWNQFLMQGAQDQETINQVNRTTRNAKISVKRLFETFKRLSKQENKRDFRLGQENYFNWLKTHYQLEQKPAKFVQVLDKNLQQAQTNLTNELDPFIEQAAASEVTLVDGENNPPTTQALPKEKKQPKKKKSAKVLQLRNGQDFYPVAEQFITTDSAQDPLQTLNKNVADALSFFVSNRTLSPRDITFAATALPQYYTYSRPYLFVPPFGNQYNPKSDFYLRLPAGNTFAQRQ